MELKKISKDNLVIWKYLFPGFLTFMHAALLSVFIYVATGGGAPFLIVYLLIFILHFVVGKVHWHFFIKDVYYAADEQLISIRDRNGIPTNIPLAEITRYRINKVGVAKVNTLKNGKIYFKVKTGVDLSFLD